jgi:hypothetical protein
VETQNLLDLNPKPETRPETQNSEPLTLEHVCLWLTLFLRAQVCLSLTLFNYVVGEISAMVMQTDEKMLKVRARI